MVWRENPPLPYEELSPKDLLDAGDLMRRFHISRPTLERYVKQHGLKPVTRVGRDRFFRKVDVERWWRRMRRMEKKWPLAVSRR